MLTPRRSLSVTASLVSLIVVAAGCNSGNPSAAIASFAATPASIVVGGSSTLSWVTTDATSFSIDQGVGTVTGTSTVVRPVTTTTYTLTATNGSSTATATATVTVTLAPPSGLAYATNPATYTRGTAIVPNTPTTSGGEVASYAVAPPLPAGLSLDATTGILSGTPSAIAPVTTHVVTAANAGGSTSASLSVTIVDVAPYELTYSTPTATYTNGVVIPINQPTYFGGPVVTWAISPALPTGLLLDTSTGVISGTPLAPAAPATYVVTATNSGGSATASLAVTVLPAPPSGLSYALNPATYPVGDAIVPNAPTSAGGAVASYAVSPALPAGLVLDTGTGILSGTPSSVAPAATYTVTATNAGGSTTVGLNIAVLPGAYAISGTVTGAWVEDVLVTLGGEASATARTGARGAYSFPGLRSGNYTVTPSLPGYGYTPAAPAVVVAGGDATQDFVATSSRVSYAISGTVSYSGPRTGPIFVSAIPENCPQCMPDATVTMAGPGAFRLRGLGDGRQVRVVAWRDFLGHGERNASDPSFTSPPMTIASSDITGVVLAMTDPAPPAPQVPGGLAVLPGDGGAAVFWNAIQTDGIAQVTGYRISWGTDPGATDRGLIEIPALSTATRMQGDVANGQVYYYKIASVVDAAQSAFSAVVGPVTIGPTAGPNVLSGTVVFPVTATGPLYVAAFDQVTGVMRSVKIANPVSPQAYEITGIPSGSGYMVVAILDQKNDGTISAGNPNNVDGAPLTAITGPTTRDLALSGDGSDVRILTDHQREQAVPDSDLYRIRSRATGQGRQPTAVVLYATDAVPVPGDLGKDSGSRFENNPDFTSARPTVGDVFRFKVWYSDGTSELKIGALEVVLDAFAGSLGTTAVPSAGVPTFEWLAPASPPANYSYRFDLWGAGAGWSYPQRGNMPSSQLSLVYNEDGRASPATLVTGSTYVWSVVVEDALRNRASVLTRYTVGPSDTLTQSTSQSVDDGIGISGAASLSLCRVFDVSATGFAVSQVQFGLFNSTTSGGDQPFTVNLYSLAGAFVTANLVLVGSQTVTFPGHSPGIVTVDVPGSVAAGSQLVVEVVAADIPESLFWGGINFLGQTAPTYFRWPPTSEPLDLATIDPTWAFVMNVIGAPP